MKGFKRMDKEESLKKVVKLFMDENDEKALKRLYKITNDPLVKMLLEWRAEHSERLAYSYSGEFSMYQDVISYIFDKYELRKK